MFRALGRVRLENKRCWVFAISQRNVLRFLATAGVLALVRPFINELVKVLKVTIAKNFIRETFEKTATFQAINIIIFLLASWLLVAAARPQRRD